MVSASEDKIIRITRIRDGKLIREMKGYTGRINSIWMTPDGKYVASSSLNKIGVTRLETSIRITRFEDGQLVRELKGPDGVSCVCSTPDGKYVMSVFDGKLLIMLVTPDSKHVVSGSHDNTIRVTRIKDGKLVREIYVTQPVKSVCVTPDMKHVVWISHRVDSAIRITRIVDEKLVHVITTHKWVGCICLSLLQSLNRKYIVTGSYRSDFCRQWIRICLLKRNIRVTTPTWQQLLAFFQMYPGLVQYVGPKLMLCVFNV